MIVMRNTYIKPTAEVVVGEMEKMVCTSGVTGGSGLGDNGLDYGGIDVIGNLEAETRQQFGFFKFD